MTQPPRGSVRVTGITHFAWSAWTFTDPQNEPWLGTFFLFRYRETPGVYQAGVRIEWTGKDGQRAGGSYAAGRLLGIQVHTVELRGEWQTTRRSCFYRAGGRKNPRRRGASRRSV